MNDRLLNSTAFGCVLGIDVGVSGGLSLVGFDCSIFDAVDIPVLEDGPAGRRTINAALMADIVRRWRPARAYVEAVGPRPGEGSIQAFAFGRSYGCVLAVLAALAIPYTLLQPAVWKRAIGIPPGKTGAKDAARAEAIRRWPEHAALFARKRDDGRAESALVAVAGLMREGQR